jgi:hypothetical protein
MEIVIIGEYGITSSIDELITLIKDNPKEFISIARINDGERNYSYGALFKDKCTIGKKTVCLQEYGTNDGMSGEGGRGFIRMNKFLNENDIFIYDYELSKEDAKKIGYESRHALSDRNERNKIWSKYMQKMR